MRCNLARKMLPLHAGGDLPEALGRWTDEHCAACAECRAELRAMRGALDPLAALGRSRRATDAAGAESLQTAARGAARPCDRPDPLGENYWLAIRRNLRSEGLVRKPGAVLTQLEELEMEEDEAPRRVIGRAAPLPGSQAVWGRAALALAAALMAGVLFLPGGFMNPRRGAEAPESTGAIVRAAGSAGSLASAAGAGDGVAAGGSTALDPVRAEAWKRAALRGTGGRLSGVGVAPAGMGARGWVEETRSFTEPSLEFGLERWRADPFDGEEAKKEDGGSLSF